MLLEYVPAEKVAYAEVCREDPNCDSSRRVDIDAGRGSAGTEPSRRHPRTGRGCLGRGHCCRCRYRRQRGDQRDALDHQQRVGGIRARRARTRHLAPRDRRAWAQNAGPACRTRGQSGTARRRAAAGRRADGSRRSVSADCRSAARFIRHRNRRREPPDPRYAARRPQFPRADAARARRGSRGSGLGGICPRRLLVQRQRRARRFQQLSARRRRQHRPEAEHGGRTSAGRRHPGIRGAHEHARSRARPAERVASERGDEIRHESAARHRVHVFSQRRTRRDELFRAEGRARSGVPARAVRILHRRAHRPGPHVLLCRLRGDAGG